MKTTYRKLLIVLVVLTGFSAAVPVEAAFSRNRTVTVVVTNNTPPVSPP